MSESKEQKERYIPWTPDTGFDLSSLTIKKVAQVTGTSSHSVKKNVSSLLKALPVKERIPILEHMVASKEKKSRGTDEEKAD